MSYKTELLEYVAEVGAGGGAPQGQDSFSESGTPFVRAGSLPLLLKGAKEESLELLTDEVARNHRLRLFPKDTILFAKSGMSATKGHIYQLKNSCYVVNHLAAIIPTEKVSASFLKYWFQIFSPSRLIQDEAYPSIRLYDIKKIEIPLPPLPEQKRIAEVLDKADALREKRRLVLQKLDLLLQSVFLEMFGDPVKNPKGWERATIRDLVSSVNYGTSEKAGQVGEFPILRMNNITYQGSWNFTDLKYIDLSEKDRKKYLVKRGDILFNRTNSKELVGKTAVYRETAEIAFAGYLIRVRTNAENNPEYISAFLNSRYGKLILNNMCKNIIGMANINAQELQDISLPKPPTELQNKFASIVEQVEKNKKKLKISLQQTENLFQSLQQKAFKGELFNNEFPLAEPQEEKVWHQTSLF